jgi:hypothetical protein
VLRRLGFPPADACRRALLAYSAYLGHGQFAHSTPGTLPAARGGQRVYVDDAIRALTARDFSPVPLFRPELACRTMAQ